LPTRSNAGEPTVLPLQTTVVITDFVHSIGGCFGSAYFTKLCHLYSSSGSTVQIASFARLEACSVLASGGSEQTLV